MSLLRKVAPDEVTPPRVEAIVREAPGRDRQEMKIIFNQNDDCFQFDVIALELPGQKPFYVSRDELAAALINGYKISNEED